MVLAIAHKRAADGPEAELTTSLWNRTCDDAHVSDKMARLAAERGVTDTVESLLAAYTAQATRALHPLKNPTLKGLLRRVIGKIFGHEPIQRYCHEFEAGHAPGRAVGAEPAA